MKKYQKFITFLLAVLLVVVAGCSTKSDAADDDTIRVGIRSSELKTWEYLAEQGKKEGLELEVIQFSSTYNPNDILADNDIDVNAFQHIAYLDVYNEEAKTDIVPIGTTIVDPLGMYSNKYDSVQDIPDGAQVALSNDPSNGGRALVLLQEAGLITLVDDYNGIGGLDKIKENPKDLDIVLVDTYQTPRALEDADIALIGNGVGSDAGIDLESSILHEDETAKPYINIIAANAENKDDEKLLKLVELYQSAETEAFINETYQGSFLPKFITIDELLTYKETYSN